MGDALLSEIDSVPLTTLKNKTHCGLTELNKIQKINGCAVFHKEIRTEFH